jgi:hypothetical protein
MKSFMARAYAILLIWAVLHQMAPGIPSIDLFADAPAGNLRWPRLFGQNFRFGKWNLCRG